ncbi:TetR/AcrR family transcriptional regulator [Actinomadura graeca]|uniref:TetR/AcrR family transcriptional regulator n=1 Tax=Actinomadura graeca TaxID=2750812 RepID=A0ABX8QQU5_9ACTN|nr:TetR/AcrR family transcriptional regulator [Actinomadura graeca]QXJ21148.1 TetR/AcrR family transcriptional regulator [Actinomadura graeca]
MEPTRTGRDTADTIQQAAIKLIHSKGYEGTSIRDIAREADVGIATLFHHFGSKAELLERTLKTEFDYLLGRMEAAVDGVDDPVERFAAAVRVHVVLHCEKPESSIVNTELRSLEPVPRAEVQVKVERVQAIFSSTLLAGVEARRFRCSRPRETARAVHGMCSSVTSWYHLGAGMTPDEVGDLYVELALRLAEADAPPPPAPGRTGRSRARRS